MMPYEPNKNHLDSMYAGALFTLAEDIGGPLLSNCFDFTKEYVIIADM